MPREGVPYPGREICSLKCQIDALQRQINELMKSINGVQGDGQGNVSLVSGDPAVVINNDASQNQIEITLDPSELPNAPVRSVNGLTGDVQLAAGNIPMYSGQPMSVQNQVAANEGMISILQSNLNQEVLDRGNADSALQTNVNGIGARVSVIEGQISEDPDPNTIAFRGATGRLKAEDPASGATDKTLVTANWVSQTGDSSPNNLIHRSGNETKTGIFACNEIRQRSYYSTKHVTMGIDLTTGTYARIYTAKITSGTDRNALILWNNTRKGLPAQVKECGILSIGGRLTTVQIANIAGTVPSNHFAITRKVNGTNDVDITLWATGQIKVFDILFESIGLNAISCFAQGDLTTTNDFTTYDEVIYL